MPSPFNPAAHEFLTANGYTHQYVPFEPDDGDLESGPGPNSQPAYDEYTSEEDYVYVASDGESGFAIRDHIAEDWVARIDWKD